MTAPARESTAVARADEKPRGIIAVLEQDKARNIITPMLPDGIGYDRVVREVFLAAQKNPEILQCSVPSVITAVADAVQLGGVVGSDVHLVPYNTNVAPKGQPKQWEKRLQAITDYKFKVEMIIRTGAARAIDAHCVYKAEHFVHEEGLTPVLEHRPIMDETARGPMVGAYAVARLAFGHVKIVVLSIGEIDAIRAKSKQWNPEKVGACPYWYAEKTCVHRLAKLLPKNPRLAKLLQRFDREEQTEAVLDDGPVAEIDAPTVRTLPRDAGTPLPARGTPGASSQAFAGYPDAEIATERITTRGEIPDPMQEEFIDDRDLDDEDGR